MFQQKILLVGQSGPRRLVLGAIFLGKGLREQYKGIHDVVNDQGFAMHYRAISNMVSQFGSFQMRENQYSKGNRWISFFMFSVIEAKIFQYGFLEEHNVCKNNHY